MQNEPIPQNLMRLLAQLLQIEPQLDKLISIVKEFAGQSQSGSAPNLRDGCSEDDRLIDSREVLIRLNISKRTLQRLRDSGELPYSRLSRLKCYYKLSDVLAYKEKGWKRPAIPQLEKNPYL